MPGFRPCDNLGKVVIRTLLLSFRKMENIDISCSEYSREIIPVLLNSNTILLGLCYVLTHLFYQLSL